MLVLLGVAILLGDAARGEPTLALRDLEGRAVRLGPQPQRPLVIAHFWASWCPTCAEELARLQALGADCPALRLAAVNVGEDEDEIRGFVAAHALGPGIEWLRDPEGEVWRELSGVGLPIDWMAAGEQVRVVLGPQSPAAWREWLAPHCAETP